MNIKSYILIIITLLVSTLAFFSCEKIEEPFFKPQYTERNILAELVVSQSTIDQALVDDFVTLYSANNLVHPVIVLSDDNAAGTAIINQLKVENATAMFNRTKFKSNLASEKALWNNHLKQELSKKGEFNLDFEGQISDDNTTYESTFSYTSLNGYDNTVTLSAYLLESNVTINNISVSDVLRQAVYNLGVADNVQRGDKVDGSFTMDLSDFSAVQISNLKLVLTLSDKTTGAILQCMAQEIGGLNFSNKQNVLIEDFTGHRCGYCPNAHIALTDLHTTFGSQIVGMAIHYSDYYASPTEDFPTDFRTEVGTVLGSTFGVSTMPTGMVNRITNGNMKLIEYTAWGNHVSELIATESDLGIIINATIDGNELKAKAFVKAFEDISGSIKIQGFITEDHIIADQKFYGHDPEHITDYEHNHVLRASINGNWGEDLTNSITKNTILEKQFTYPLNSEWNKSNLSLIIMVYDDSTKEVIQVEQVHLH